jgi:uncharacterized protein (DUF2236 family)
MIGIPSQLYRTAFPRRDRNGRCRRTLQQAGGVVKRNTRWCGFGLLQVRNYLAAIFGFFAARARYIANQPDLQLQWLFSRHLTLVGILTQFRAGQFILETPPSKTIGYVTVYATYRF